VPVRLVQSLSYQSHLPTTAVYDFMSAAGQLLAKLIDLSFALAFTLALWRQATCYLVVVNKPRIGQAIIPLPNFALSTQLSTGTLEQKWGATFWRSSLPLSRCHTDDLQQGFVLTTSYQLRGKAKTSNVGARVIMAYRGSCKLSRFPQDSTERIQCILCR